MSREATNALLLTLLILVVVVGLVVWGVNGFSAIGTTFATAVEDERAFRGLVLSLLVVILINSWMRRT